VITAEDLPDRTAECVSQGCRIFTMSSILLMGGGHPFTKENDWVQMTAMTDTF
jgi:hypothetical protein